MRFQDQMQALASHALKMGMGILHRDSLAALARGTFIFDMRDARTGEQLEY